MQKAIERFSPGVIMFLCLAIPGLGCWLAVTTQNTAWLLLLAPLLIFQEAGIGLGLVAVFVMAAVVQ